MSSRRLSRLATSVVLVFVALASLGLGPCGPIPGGRLTADEAANPPPSWAIADEVPRCAVEVRPDSPHSVTVNCMSWQGRLFVSCSRCEGKTWSGIALEEPRGRVLIGDEVYPVTLRRVVDPEELDAVWLARARKLGNEEPGVRPEEWWTFELRGR